PRRVVHLPDRELAGIACDDAIDELRRIPAANHVLEQRRDVDQRRCVAYRVVFVLVVRFVRADRVIAGPLAEVQAFTQRQRPLVDGGSNWHRRIISTAMKYLLVACVAAATFVCAAAQAPVAPLL